MEIPHYTLPFLHILSVVVSTAIAMSFYIFRNCFVNLMLAFSWQ